MNFNLERPTRIFETDTDQKSKKTKKSIGRRISSFNKHSSFILKSSVNKKELVCKVMSGSLQPGTKVKVF